MVIKLLLPLFSSLWLFFVPFKKFLFFHIFSFANLCAFYLIVLCALFFYLYLLQFLLLFFLLLLLNTLFSSFFVFSFSSICRFSMCFSFFVLFSLKFSFFWFSLSRLSFCLLKFSSHYFFLPCSLFLFKKKISRLSWLFSFSFATLCLPPFFCFCLI